MNVYMTSAQQSTSNRTEEISRKSDAKSNEAQTQREADRAPVFVPDALNSTARRQPAAEDDSLQSEMVANPWPQGRKLCG